MSCGFPSDISDPARPIDTTADVMKSTLRRGRPLLLLFGGTMGAALSSMLAQLVLARSLDVADYGRLAAILAAANLLSPIAGFGLNGFWIQVFGREGWGAFRWVAPSLRLIGVTSLAMLAVLAAYLWFAGSLPHDQRAWITLFAGVLLLGQVAVDFASTRFQLEERFGALAVWQTLPQVGRLAIALLLLAAPAAPLLTVLAGYAAIAAVLIALALRVARQFVVRRIALVGHAAAGPDGDAMPAPGMARTAKLAFPFAFITVFYLVYFQSSIVLLNAILGARETAIFSAALLVMAAIYLVPAIVFTKFLTARICRWADHDPASYAAVLHVSVAAMLVSGIVLMVALMVGAPIAIQLLFGPNYAATVAVLVWLAPTVPIRFVQSAYSAVLVSEVDVRRRVAYAGIGAAVSLALNLSLLPWIGLRGAVIASLGSETALLLLNMWGVHRHVAAIDIRDACRPSRLRAAARHLSRGAA